MRYIPVETCNTCPHFTHCGAFGDVAYIPKCERKDKTLPFETKAGTYSRHGGPRLVAVPTGVIPDWCPLPEAVS